MRLSRRTLGTEAIKLVRELDGDMKSKLTAWMEGVSRNRQLKQDLLPVEAAASVDSQIMLAWISMNQGATSEAVLARLLLALSALRA
jgi:hypothetical protein